MFEVNLIQILFCLNKMTDPNKYNHSWGRLKVKINYSLAFTKQCTNFVNNFKHYEMIYST